MPPKNTREGSMKASKGSDQLNSKAETDIEATAMTKADADNVSMNFTAVGRNTKKRRVSTTTNETSDTFLASSALVTANISAGATGCEDASTSGVPRDNISAATSGSVVVGMTVIPMGRIGEGDGDGDAGGKIKGGGMHGGSGGGSCAGKALSMDDSATHSEMMTNVLNAAAESTSPILGNGSIVSVADAAVAGAGAVVAATATAVTYNAVISNMARANESNVFTAENYYLLHWLYRIRDVSCPRGLRISFLQPDFLWSIYRPMMRSKKLWRTDGDIRVAVDLWCFNRAAAEERYGHISDWDVSSVTNMSELFQRKRTFNDDISRWDVSKVTNMSYMFFGAHAFTQGVGDWDASSVTDMNHMFCGARSFSQPVGNWDVSKVTDMSGMFARARSFNQPVGDWDVSKVTNMGHMFWDARSFNQPVGDWDVSKVTNMGHMFCYARAFDQNLARWDMSSVEATENMFRGANAMQRDNKPVAVRDDVYDA